MFGLFLVANRWVTSAMIKRFTLAKLVTGFARPRSFGRQPQTSYSSLATRFTELCFVSCLSYFRFIYFVSTEPPFVQIFSGDWHVGQSNSPWLTVLLFRSLSFFFRFAQPPTVESWRSLGKILLKILIFWSIFRPYWLQNCHRRSAYWAAWLPSTNSLLLYF